MFIIYIIHLYYRWRKFTSAAVNASSHALHHRCSVALIALARVSSIRCPFPNHLSPRAIERQISCNGRYTGDGAWKANNSEGTEADDREAFNFLVSTCIYVPDRSHISIHRLPVRAAIPIEREEYGTETAKPIVRFLFFLRVTVSLRDSMEDLSWSSRREKERKRNRRYTKWNTAFSRAIHHSVIIAIVVNKLFFILAIGYFIRSFGDSRKHYRPFGHFSLESFFSFEPLEIPFGRFNRDTDRLVRGERF